MSSKLLSIILLLFVAFPMHGIVQYDYKAFFLPYNFGHLYTWTFTISNIVTQASLVEISDKTFAIKVSFKADIGRQKVLHMVQFTVIPRTAKTSDESWVTDLHC